MAQARELLGQRISATLQECFARDLAFWAEDPTVRRGPGWRAAAAVDADGVRNPGHDPSRAPVVPPAEVVIRRDADDGARIEFTYKVEAGYPPFVSLRVPRNWLSTVAAPEWVVLGGLPILEIVERDPAGRPSAVRVAVIGGHFDPAMHGWRGHGHTHLATVIWSDESARVGDSARVEVDEYLR